MSDDKKNIPSEEEQAKATKLLENLVQLEAERQDILKKTQATKFKIAESEQRIQELNVQQIQAHIETLKNSEEITEEIAKQIVQNEKILQQEQDKLKLMESEITNINSLKEGIDKLGTAWQTGFTGKLIDYGKNLDEIGKKLKDTFSAKNIAGTLAETMVQSTMMAVKAADNARASMAAQTGQGHLLNDAMADVADSSLAFGVSFDEAAQSLTALSSGMSDFTQMSTATKVELGETVSRLGALGVSADTATANIEIGRKVMGLTASAAAQMTKDMAALAVGIGTPAGQLAESFKSAAPQLASYGDQMINVFEDLAKTSKATGVEINELLGITTQFDTFEGAANAAGKLNSILGGDVLNSTELLLASEEERLDMIRQSITASGQNFDSMNRFQRMAVANAAGIKDMATANKLFSEQQRAAQAATDMNAVSQEELEKRQKAGVSVQKQMTQMMQMFAVAVMPIVEILHGFMSMILGLNDAFGGFFLQAVIAVVGAMYLLRGATAAVASVKATYATLTASGIGLKMKEAVTDRAASVSKLFSASAQETENASKKRGIAMSLASMASTAKERVVKYATAAASIFSTGATNAETASKSRGMIIGKAAAIFERSWAATKTAIAGASMFVAKALGFQAAASTASVVPNAAAAAGEVGLGTGAYFAVVPVGLLALAIGIAAMAVAIFAVAMVGLVYIILEFLKYLIESPVRILYAVAAFAVLALGLYVVSLAMGTVALAGLVMAASLLLMLQMMQLAAPLMPVFMGVMIGLSVGVFILGLAFAFLAVSMVAIAMAMASMVKSTAQMASGSGLIEFRSAVAELVDDLERMEQVLSIMTRFATVSAMMSVSLGAVSSSLVIMSFGLALVAGQMERMSNSMKAMEGVNASFESAMTVATQVTPESVQNVTQIVDQAERYTQSQIQLKSGLVEGFVDALTNVASAIAPSGEGDAGNEQVIVLKLDDREFGRAVGNVVGKKMSLKS